MIELALKLALVPLFAVTNRIRGKTGLGGVIGGAVLAGAIFLITQDPVAAGICGLLYIGGESVGWGRWLKAIPAVEQNVSQQEYWDNYRQPTRGKEIHKIANSIAKESKDYRRYVKTALYVRAAIWFPPIFLALTLLGHTTWPFALAAALVSIFTFPLAYGLSYQYKPEHYWARGEVFYGVAQGLSLLLAFSSVYF